MRADRVLQEGDLLAQLVVVPHDGDAADHIGMAVQVFRGRMHDEVEAELDRSLHIGAREGVVRGEPGPLPITRLLDNPGDRLEIAELQQRIGRRLDPDEPRLGAKRCADSVEIGEIDIGDD
jgi:hypothetical protein